MTTIAAIKEQQRAVFESLERVSAQIQIEPGFSNRWDRLWEERSQLLKEYDRLTQALAGLQSVAIAATNPSMAMINANSVDNADRVGLVGLQALQMSRHAFHAYGLSGAYMGYPMAAASIPMPYPYLPAAGFPSLTTYQPTSSQVPATGEVSYLSQQQLSSQQTARAVQSDRITNPSAEVVRSQQSSQTVAAGGRPTSTTDSSLQSQIQGSGTARAAREDWVRASSSSNSVDNRRMQAIAFLDRAIAEEEEGKKAAEDVCQESAQRSFGVPLLHSRARPTAEAILRQ